MFGFGMGRIAPNDHTFNKMEKDTKRGRTVSIPAMTAIRVLASQFAMLKSMPRAGFVTASQTEFAAEEIRREPGLRVEDLSLPTSLFVFEMEPIEVDIATIRVVLARVNLKDGVPQATLRTMSFCGSVNKWSFTVPGTFVLLNEFGFDNAHRAAVELSCGLPRMQHEMNLAASGLLVIARRQAEMLSATRH